MPGGRAGDEREAHYVLDALSPHQLEQLTDIADALLPRLDPARRLTALYEPAAN